MDSKWYFKIFQTKAKTVWKYFEEQKFRKQRKL